MIRNPGMNMSIPVMHIIMSDIVRIPRFLYKGSIWHLSLEQVMIRRYRFCGVCSLGMFVLSKHKLFTMKINDCEVWFPRIFVDQDPQ